MKQHLTAFVVLGILVGTAGAAQAQKLDLFAGYSFENDDIPGAPAGLHGYNFAATWNFNPNVGIEANFAGHQGNSILQFQSNPAGAIIDKHDIRSYVVGPKLTRVIGPGNKFAAYMHFMVGGMRVHDSRQYSGWYGTLGTSASGTGVGFVAGFGLDWNHSVWGLRILETDYSSGSNITTSYRCGANCTLYQKSSQSDFRIASGLIWRFGKK